MGIYEDRQFERFADSVSPLHDRDTARELWADGPDDEPAEEVEEHTDPQVEWDGAQVPTAYTRCRNTGAEQHLDDQTFELIGPAWAPDTRWVQGTCQGCGAYLELRVETDGRVEVSCDEGAA